ncbi:MAG: YedE-related selenium metabolism membrane protein [Firmicutes bacterium]|nr:YedE-related selenium metabolism membrane protein [Bacillota bacterium]
MERRDAMIVGTGLVIGILAALLVKFGNPGNMGLCIACFIRDITGALGLHRAAPVQYLRPEIPGLLLGAFLAAVLGREFRSRGGSGSLVRFLLGFFMMVGALVFLGCPLRTLLRLGGGDLNAVLGLAGFTVGVLGGVEFLKRGYNLGRARRGSAVGGLVMPLLAVVILVLAIYHPVFDPKAGGPVFASLQGPGSFSAPVLMSLGAGLLVGILAQRARLCLSGGIRDFVLTRDAYLLKGYGAIFAGVLLANILLGQFRLGFANQPIAHTDGAWNFLGMVLVGLAAVLAGGCPLRQLILSGEGDADAGMSVLGMAAGAAVAHNFLLASSPAGPTLYGKVVVLLGILIAVLIGWFCREA